MRTTGAAASDLVPHSVTEGDRLEEVYLVPGTRAGRSVGGSSQDVYVIGVEIGGRGQRVALANGAGEIVGQARSIDGTASAETVVETVRTLIDQATFTTGVPLSRVQRVGVAFGGPVDPARGLTLLSHRAPGFEDFPLVNILEERVGVPTVLDNDARAAALGEAMFGAARGSINVVYVHLGTGVGAGIIVDGRLLHGTSSTAGEIGHMVITSGGPICSCGKPGHLEAYAAGPAIIARFQERLREAPEGEIARWGTEPVTVRTIFQDARRAPGAAREVVDETVQVLGQAVANLITVLSPAVVVIGGSVADVGTPLMDPLSARVRQYSYPAAARRVRLCSSEFRSDAGVVGAVALALASLRE